MDIVEGRAARHRSRNLLATLCCTLVLVLAGCTGAPKDPKASEAPKGGQTVQGAVTLAPSRGTTVGGNVVMVDIAGLPDELASMQVQAQFGAASRTPCEFDQVVAQFACRAPSNPDPVTVPVSVTANGNNIEPVVPYTYTTGGYEDMPVVTLNLSTLQRNAAEIAAQYPVGVKLGVVLKNGDPVGTMGKAIADVAPVDYFFVPKLSDGIALREAGVTAPINILYLTETADIPLLLRYNLEPTARSAAWVEQANKVLDRTKGTLKVHLWIDTGLGREGVMPEEALALAKVINDSPHLKLQGIATHLCCVVATDAQALQRNDRTNATVLQKSRFDQAVAQIRGAGIGQDALLHVGASDVLSNNLNTLYYDMMRVGGMFFVSGPINGQLYTWTTKVDQVKTLPAGWCIDYGCLTRTTKATKVGLLSHIPAREGPIAFVVRGKTAPVLLNHGTVVTLDLSAIPDAVEGDEVTIQFNPANGQLLDTNLPVPVTVVKP